MRKKKTSYILVLSIAVVLLFRSTIAVSAQNQTDYVAWSDYMAYERFQSKYDYLMNTDLIWSNKLFSIDQRKKFTDIVSEFLYQRISRPNPDRVFAHWLSEKKNRDSSLIFLFTAQLSAANMEFSDALSHLNRAKYGLESTNLWALSADIDTDIRRRSTWQQQVKDFALFDYNLPFQGVGQIKSIVFSSTNESIFFTDKVNHYRASGLNCFKQNMDTLSFGEGSPKECQLSSIYGDTYYFSCRNELRGDLDIFKAKLNGTIFSDFKGLPSPINTVADETDFHRSNNGEFAFFSSSRPGGLGGLDIYVAIQKELQQGMPVKYMLNLNTMADDRVTSLGDGGELFLSTPGRNLQQKKEFYIAQSASDSDFTISNLGYPINSFLDNDEVLAYTNGVLLKTFGPELQKKIIGVFLNSTVPFTIVRGTLVEQKNGVRSFLKSEVKFVDKETNSVSDLVFMPDTKPGFFYAILQPGKQYDMLISSEGYKSHIVSLKLPYQHYFYTIFQQIDLTPLQVGSKQVGQQIKVQNTFFDIYKVAANGVERPYDLNAYSSLTKIKDLTAFLIGEQDSLAYLRLSGSNSFNEHQDALFRKKNYLDLIAKIGSAFQYSDTCLIKTLAQNAYASNKFSESYFYNDITGKNAIVDFVIGENEYPAFGPMDTKIANRANESQLWNEYQKVTKLFEGALLDLQGVAYSASIHKRFKVFSLPIDCMYEGKINLEKQLEIEKYLDGLAKPICDSKIIIVIPKSESSPAIPATKDIGTVFDFMFQKGVLHSNITICRDTGCTEGNIDDKNCSTNAKEPIKVLILETTEY